MDSRETELHIKIITLKFVFNCSDRTTGMGRFSPLFYGKKDQQLPFTDSDGLYDFPSSDGKGNYLLVNNRKTTSGKRKERKSSKSGN